MVLFDFGVWTPYFGSLRIALLWPQCGFVGLFVFRSLGAGFLFGYSCRSVGLVFSFARCLMFVGCGGWIWVVVVGVVAVQDLVV